MRQDAPKKMGSLAFCSIAFEEFCAEFTSFSKIKKSFLKLFTKLGEMCYNIDKKMSKGKMPYLFREIFLFELF